ncbi:MAG: DUF72 domain-containing protein [bacterium]|nr:DUF72 domain-containing protein [bacterium]
MAVHYGTCSWKYDSWEGIVYPSEGKYNFLEEYAKHHDSVEVDQWFWSLFGADKVKLPETKTVDDYLSVVPRDFKFAIKIPNSISLTHFYTHGKPKGAPLEPNPYFFSVELFHKFLAKIEPLKEQTGVLMFQFEYLNRQKMGSQGEFLQRFGEFMQQCPYDYNYAVEIRNPNYLNEKYFRFLEQNGMSHVFVHGYYMPPVTDVYKKYSDFIQRLAVIRLMGKDRKGIEKISGNKWDKLVDPRDDELPGIVEMIKKLEEKKVMVFCNINNHYEGSAPLTIKKIQEMLEQMKASWNG